MRRLRIIRASKCIHELFEAQVARTPDAVAVVFGDVALSYSELNARANRLAHHLIGLGIGPEERVALCAASGRSRWWWVCSAILKAGAAYVPLDPAYPPDRLAFMLANAKPRTVITDVAIAEQGLFDPGTSCVVLNCADLEEALANARTGQSHQHPAYHPDSRHSIRLM